MLLEGYGYYLFCLLNFYPFNLSPIKYLRTIIRLHQSLNNSIGIAIPSFIGEWAVVSSCLQNALSIFYKFPPRIGICFIAHFYLFLFHNTSGKETYRPCCSTNFAAFRLVGQKRTYLFPFPFLYYLYLLYIIPHKCQVKNYFHFLEGFFKENKE